jgi:hypothetical protein
VRFGPTNNCLVVALALVVASASALAQNTATGILINCSTQMLTASTDSCKASSGASVNQRCALSTAPDELFTQKYSSGQ